MVLVDAQSKIRKQGQALLSLSSALQLEEKRRYKLAVWIDLADQHGVINRINLGGLSRTFRSKQQPNQVIATWHLGTWSDNVDDLELDGNGRANIGIKLHRNALSNSNII